jgi:hypothetical protein
VNDLTKLSASGAPLAISQVMTTGMPGVAPDVEAEAETSTGAEAAVEPETVKEGPLNWKSLPS